MTRVPCVKKFFKFIRASIQQNKAVISIYAVTTQELSILYTNHCKRATCNTILDQRGIKARHIMYVSGHRSETSIKSYLTCVSESKNKKSLVHHHLFTYHQSHGRKTQLLCQLILVPILKNLLLNLDNCCDLRLSIPNNCQIKRRM